MPPQSLTAERLLARQGRANVLGGQLSGSFEARLSPEPSYSLDGQFSRVDLRDVAALVALPGRAGGLASGELKLAAHGADRAALLASLQGQGLMRARDAWFDQSEPAAEGTVTAASASDAAEVRPFALTAPFQIADRSVRFNQAVLTRPGEQTEITGAIDFARRLDLRLRSLPRALTATIGDAVPGDSWTVAGTLDAPHITSAPAPAPVPPLASSTAVPEASASR